jgi:hypothetical protein
VSAADGLMCPHCGRLVGIRKSGLTFTHWDIGDYCPGSGQNPRCAESDGRPLWNGEPNPHYFRNAGQPESVRASDDPGGSDA